MAWLSLKSSPTSKNGVSGARLEEEKSGVVLLLEFPKKKTQRGAKDLTKETEDSLFFAQQLSGQAPHPTKANNSAPELVVLREQFISLGLISFANTLGLRNHLNWCKQAGWLLAVQNLMQSPKELLGKEEWCALRFRGLTSMRGQCMALFFLHSTYKLSLNNFPISTGKSSVVSVW